MVAAVAGVIFAVVGLSGEVNGDAQKAKSKANQLYDDPVNQIPVLKNAPSDPGGFNLYLNSY